MYDTLLFLHLLAAFMLAVTVVTYTAVALGATTSGRTLFVADRCWDVGGLGTLVLGIWLALHLDEYDFWDGWILGAIALWFVATGLGQSTQRRLAEDPGAEHRGDALVAHAHRARPARPDDLEAGRMTLLASIRPDDWNLPLFLHVLGAMTLVGALGLVVLSLASARGGDSAAACGSPTARCCFAAIPAWIVMRLSAQWIAIEGGARRPRRAAGLDRHRLRHLRAHAAPADRGHGLRRHRGAPGAEGGRAFGGLNTAALVLVSISLLAYVLAIWAMSTKPLTR